MRTSTNQNKISKNVLTWATLAVFSAVVSNAHAADTVEQFDPGASDVEVYAGYEGLGNSVTDQTAYGEVVAGFGLTSFLSAYLGTQLAGNGNLAAGSADLYWGAYVTPLDSDHIDLDILLDFAYSFSEDAPLSVSPGFELNFDLKPDLSFMGFWLAAGAGVYGETLAVENVVDTEEADRRFDTYFDLPFLVGYYVTLAERHQLLMTFDSTIVKAFNDDREFDLGNLALGYNVVLTDNLELITEVFMDLPQDDENVAVGAMAGLIGTI